MRNLTSILCVLMLATFAFAQLADVAPGYAEASNTESLTDLPWDMLFPVTAGDTLPTVTLYMVGCEFVNGQLFVTAGISNPCTVFVYDWNGSSFTLNTQFAQWSTGGGWGWRDLAWDGTYLYGSDDYVVDAFLPDGTPAPSMNINGPSSPNRMLAYDPVTDTFWTASFSSALYNFTRTGTVLSTTSLGLTGQYGAAWNDATGMLWIHDQTYPGGSGLTLVEIDPSGPALTGNFYDVPLLPGSTSQTAGGLAWTPAGEADPLVPTYVGFSQGSPVDRPYILESDVPGGVPSFTVTLTYNYGSPVPAGGGAINFDAWLQNNETFPVNFDLWIEIPPQVTPPSVPNRNLTFPAGHIIDRDDMNWPITAAWPAGNYTMDWYIGDMSTWTAWASDSFPFVKSADDDGSGYVLWEVDGDPLDQLFEGIDLGEMVVNEFALLSAYPNPFNPTTTLSYALPKASRVKLIVYDITGQQVAELVDGWRDMGMHEAVFDASNLASGVYIYNLTAGTFNATGKMVMMK